MPQQRPMPLHQLQGDGWPPRFEPNWRHGYVPQLMRADFFSIPVFVASPADRPCTPLPVPLRPSGASSPSAPSRCCQRGSLSRGGPWRSAGQGTLVGPRRRFLSRIDIDRDYPLCPRGCGIESGFQFSPLNSDLRAAPRARRAPHAERQHNTVHRFRKWCGTRSSTARKAV